MRPKRLLLVGGGHAQLFVLEALARVRVPGIMVSLVTPDVFQTYSGMVPGWMAGHYALRDCQIDLRPLARAAGVDLVIDTLARLDGDARCVQLASGRRLGYDLLSLAVGSETDTSWLELLGDRLLAVKPLPDFCAAWPRVLAAALQRPGLRLAVVGGGAAGVELALAARAAFAARQLSAEVSLVSSQQGLLPGRPTSARRYAMRALSRAGAHLHVGPATSVDDGLLLADHTRLKVDCVIAATGARPPAWFAASGLARDASGHILVDACQRSVSHPEVLVAGDASARAEPGLERSGVHAVRAGPILAENLLAILAGRPLTSARPQRRTLYLLSCGSRRAIAMWGNWSLEGRWVWYWKRWIDRRFVRRFTRSDPRPQVAPPRQEQAR
ncbi:MAG: FAD-dependent oxidoreductase [Pseudomonadota bacterium]|nr:FAD-dependent oxidoreductase [Pseudomonadota bacterium]